MYVRFMSQLSQLLIRVYTIRDDNSRVLTSLSSQQSSSKDEIYYLTQYRELKNPLDLHSDLTLVLLIHFRWKVMYLKQSQAGHEISLGSWDLWGETFWLSFKYKYIWGFYSFLFLVVLNCVDFGLSTQLSDEAIWCWNWLLNNSRGIRHTEGWIPQPCLGLEI